VTGGRWEHTPHGADIGVRGYGETPGEAFGQAALALTALVTEPAGVGGQQEVTITCGAPDMEMLFVEWLNAVIFEMATRNISTWTSRAGPSRREPPIRGSGSSASLSETVPFGSLSAPTRFQTSACPAS